LRAPSVVASLRPKSICTVAACTASRELAIKAKENKDFFMTKESKPVQQSGVNGNHENLIIYYIYFLWHQSSSIKMIEIYNMFNENKMDFY
jgi:hypothetical protein